MILAGSAAMLVETAKAATWTWGNGNSSWSVAGAWSPASVPASNPATELIFGGNASTLLWLSTNDLGTAANPFTLNKITLTGQDADPLNSGLQFKIDGNLIRFAGTNPEITHPGPAGNPALAANVIIDTPIAFNGSLKLSGDGTGTVTFNSGVSGVGDIVQSGMSTYRFGTKPSAGAEATTPSANTWMGNLVIGDGTIRFNNNAQAASSALRANPVVFTGNGTLSARRDTGDQTSGYSTSLRMGTLSGDAGTVDAQIAGNNTSNYDIVITALTDGTFGGTIIIPKPTGTGNDGGDLVVRGPGNQTLSATNGTVNIWKDSVVGNGATLTLTGNASLSNFQSTANGSTTLAGGSLVLDNSAIYTSDRLRDGAWNSTTVDTIGGGTLRLIGQPSAATTELTGRLQLGSANNPRSGMLRVVVQPTTNSAAGLTQLSFQSYSRDQSVIQQLATVEFSAQFNGGPIQLGGASAKIFIESPGFFTPPNPTGLLDVTAGTSSSVGWATISGTSGLQFANYSSNGVVAASATAWSTNQAATANAQLSGAGFTSNTGQPYAVNSVRLLNGAALSILGTDTLSTTAILLANAGSALIQATGGGSIGGNGPRFLTVAQSATLTVSAPLTGSAQPIVKSGDGTLVLNSNHATYDQVVAVNAGALRATPGSTLPRGELRIRGGQMEIDGGTTFARTIGFGPNTVNWTGVDASGLDTEIEEDRGSGGFGAVNGDANVVLNGSSNALISWEDIGFLGSGYALTFGSRSATNRVTWTNNLSLSAASPTVVNYNAREFYVHNNPTTTGDTARVSGTISGRITNDLLKTGPGDLELTGNNTYLGATIVHGGRLFVNGNGQSSFLHKVMTGGTLAGKGTVGAVVVDAGGKLMPGVQDAVASILTTKDLQFTDATSKLTIEIGGNVAGGDSASGYDQIRALDAGSNATVRLNGATLEATFLNGYLAGVSDLFFLILNDGTDAVIGQFAQGNALTIGSQTFAISYAANSDTNSFTGGNDVALQLVPEPSTALLLGLGTLLVSRRRRQVA